MIYDPTTEPPTFQRAMFWAIRCWSAITLFAFAAWFLLSALIIAVK